MNDEIWRQIRGMESLVDLFTPAGRVKKKVHSLVAEHFVGARPEGTDIRHLDGDKLNNAATNLAYGSRSENNLDQVMHGTHPEASKTHCKRGHEFTPDNTRIETTGARRCLTCARSRRRKEAA